MAEGTGDDSTTKKARVGLSRDKRAKVYAAMRETRFKTTGHGFEPPIAKIQAASSVEEAEQIHTDAYQTYTFGHMDRLHGMVAVMSIIEDRPEKEIFDSLV